MPPSVIFLCTGNAARSVIAGAALARRLPELAVATAGTLTIDGQPMSHRTRAALAAVGIEPPAHRSRQASPANLDRADLVVALAPEHVRWVRRTHGAAAGRTATLRRLVRDLPTVSGPLEDRITALNLAGMEPEPWEEVIDPGGGEVEDFVGCARQVVDLVDGLAAALALGDHQTMAEETPAEIHRKVEQAFNSGDVDALVELYEPDAQMVTPDGLVTGTDAIRQNWTFLLSLGATMSLETRYAYRNGNISLLRNDYRVTGPDVDLAGSTSEVARLGSDGKWRYVIDHPFGAGNLDD